MLTFFLTKSGILKEGVSANMIHLLCASFSMQNYFKVRLKGLPIKKIINRFGEQGGKKFDSRIDAGIE